MVMVKERGRGKGSEWKKIRREKEEGGGFKEGK